MPRNVIIIFLLALSAVFATMEFLLNPPKTFKMSEETTKENVLQAETASTAAAERPVFMRVDTAVFAEAGIKEIKMQSLRATEAFFRGVPVNIDGDFFASSAVFAEGEQVLLKITEFHPQKEITSAKIFDTLKSTLYNRVSADAPKDPAVPAVNQTNSFGEHSFYYNDPKSSEMVFLVVKKADKIMAFEYLKVDHEKLAPVIEAIFP